jgi:4-diphosphocytidyl-2-C-methyl-D-erythritol kinase
MIVTDYRDDLGRLGLQFQAIIGAELSRLRLVLTDTESWILSEPVRLLSTKQANEVIYGFVDGTRAFLTFVQLPQNRVRILLRHENIESTNFDYREFWSSLFETAKNRLSAEPLTIASAPGKLNLFFKVGNRKSNGYHDVVSVYQELSLRETVIISSSHDWSLAISGSISQEQIAEIPTDGNNLAFKAVKMVAEKANLAHPIPVAIGIDKHVPVAGGMGGGSADAAATLLALASHWATDSTKQDFIDSAVELGADVPFALLGGTAVAHGVGEKLRSIELGQRLHWVIVPNSGGLSTPDVFKRLDEIRTDKKIEVDDANYLVDPHYLIDALAAGNPFDIAEFMQNDLQEAALDLMPSLAITLQDGIRCGALKAMVSGSGPTVVLLAGSEPSAIEISNQMRILGYETVLAHSDKLGTVVEG